MKPVNNRNISFLQQTSGWALLILCILSTNSIFAQDNIPTDSATLMPAKKTTQRKLFGGEITSIGYGGPVLKFSRFNNQFALMTGGHGACTINNRYTIGGSGYGIASGVNLYDSESNTNRLFKMGYGGLDLGYIFYHGKKTNFGSSMLFAGGAAFWQNKTKEDGEKRINGFKIFPVFEPSVYGELALSRVMRLHAGFSYRYVIADLSYIKNRSINGFSCFAGLLFGKNY